MEKEGQEFRQEKSITTTGKMEEGEYLLGSVSESRIKRLQNGKSRVFISMQPIT